VHVCVIGHALLHIPQCIALEVKSTHAAPHIVSAPQSTAHEAERQTCPMGQAVPQAPQFIASELVSTHTPLQTRRGAAQIGRHAPTAHS
jgi:hypothetical protein